MLSCRWLPGIVAATTTPHPCIYLLLRTVVVVVDARRLTPPPAGVLAAANISMLAAGLVVRGIFLASTTLRPGINCLVTHCVHDTHMRLNAGYV
jgi:hypothetical protein